MCCWDCMDIYWYIAVFKEILFMGIIKPKYQVLNICCWMLGIRTEDTVKLKAKPIQTWNRTHNSIAVATKRDSWYCFNQEFQDKNITVGKKWTTLTCLLLYSFVPLYPFILVVKDFEKVLFVLVVYVFFFFLALGYVKCFSSSSVIKWSPYLMHITFILMKIYLLFCLMLLNIFCCWNVNNFLLHVL